MNKRTSTWAYIAVIALAASGLSLYWFQVWPGPVLPAGSLVVLFVILAVSAQHFPLPIGPQRKVDASISVYFAALLLFGAAVAVLLVGLAQLLGQSTLAARRNPSTGRHRRGAPEVVFNTSQLVLATGLGSLVYFAFLPYQAPAPLERIENVWALPAMATTMYVANSLAVAGIVGIQLTRNPIQVWLSGRRTHTLEFAGLVLCGLVTAIATIQAAWAPLAMLLLTAILYLSLQRTLQLLSREQEMRVEAQNTAENIRRLQGVIEREHTTLAAVMASMSDGLLVLDEAGQVRYSNAQAAVLLNVDLDAVVDQSALSVIRQIGPSLAEPATAFTVWERMIKHPHEQSSGEITIVGPPKRAILLSAFTISAQSDARNGILLRDITVPKQLALLEERERIAMDLHDDVIQELYGVGLALSAQARTLGEHSAPAILAIRRAVGQIDDVIQEIRNAIFDLRPRSLSSRELGAGLTELVSELRITGLPRPRLELESGIERLLGPDAVISVLQIAREATTNTIRHASASEATIRMVHTGRHVLLTLCDDGKGFDPHAICAHAGQGLQNMAERARMLGGQLTVLSAPGRGTEIRLEIPVVEEATI